jgi:hypothetical protein
MILRRTVLSLMSVVVAACASPLPIGPGRVAVTLEETNIRVIENDVLFPEFVGRQADRAPRQVVQFRISSQTDLLKYFKDWDRQLQVRCSVEGNNNGRKYDSFGIGPLPEGGPQNGGNNSGQVTPGSKHHYTIYAFIDLIAEDHEFEDGKPATTLNLKVDHFESLRCHLLGVTMAAVIFPRSNDFVITVDRFQTLLRQASPP